MANQNNSRDQLPVVKAHLPSVQVQAPLPQTQQVQTDIDAPRRTGLLILFAVFGVFGIWAAFAPIQGAAHAQGTVTVSSYKKSIQHLEGGMIDKILVQNGDHVEAGQVLLEMDGTQSLAQLEIANSQSVALMALEARLIAERDGLESIHYPAALPRTDATAVAEMAAQDQVFKARKASRDGNVAVLEQRIEQLRSRISGLEAMKESKELLAASFNQELVDTRILLEQGFSDKLRLREMERSYAVYKGEAAELLANVSATQMQVGETQLQILQLENEFRSEVVTHLSETQTRLKDVRERMTALNDVASRTKVRAPVAGIVTGMQFHTEGGVIGPGTLIAEVVPQSDDLVIESRVSLIDIDRVHEGQEATIRFSSFGNRTPTIYGNVLSVSADAVTDQRTGMPYYLARVTVNPESLEALNGLTLVPGMPAEVFIASGPRTFLQYVMKPLSNSMARSLKED